MQNVIDCAYGSVFTGLLASPPLINFIILVLLSAILYFQILNFLPPVSHLVGRDPGCADWGLPLVWWEIWHGVVVWGSGCRGIAEETDLCGRGWDINWVLEWRNVGDSE